MHQKPYALANLALHFQLRKYKISIRKQFLTTNLIYYIYYHDNLQVPMNQALKICSLFLPLFLKKKKIRIHIWNSSNSMILYQKNWTQAHLKSNIKQVQIS